MTPRRVLRDAEAAQLRRATTSRIFGTRVVNELQGRLQPAEVRRHRVRAGRATTRRRSRCPARSTRSRSTRAARPASPAAACSSARPATRRPTARLYNPRSISLSDALTLTRGAHTFKFGGEYRNIESQFQFLGSTEITYNGINEFIDNRPAQIAVALDSPIFKPQQYYAIGFAQDTWRATSRLTLELGLRYDFYSVVKEKNGQARPFFIEDNAFATDRGRLLRPGQEQLRAAPVGGLPADRQDRAARRLRALLRARAVRGSHPADRELHRAPPRADRRHPDTGWPTRSTRRSTATCSRSAATRTIGPTSTTSSTARACRRSCRRRST